MGKRVKYKFSNRFRALVGTSGQGNIRRGNWKYSKILHDYSNPRRKDGWWEVYRRRLLRVYVGENY